MSLVPWPTASVQTAATRCCHDDTPSTAKMPVKNKNNAFVTTLLLKETRTVTTRKFAQPFCQHFNIFLLAYLKLPSQSETKLAWAVQSSKSINCSCLRLLFDWSRRTENQHKDVKKFNPVLKSVNTTQQLEKTRLACKVLRVRTFLIFLITENFWVSIKLSSMTLMAMLTSSSVTYSLRCIFAWASAIRIIDSMCRTVMGIEPVAYEHLAQCHK